ncbi:MAG: T9SS type A sorting domain-containing protein [Flavobacteriales bacterium]|nr:T9SS type A sorting domain-containing protein [Flavobacteriales bacterium]MCB9203437.1 T9SS type A sorting domain-containing protein [Flavobacteriales bacterium]
MLRTTIILSFLLAGLTSYAQDVIFDHMHEDDGAIYLVEQNGEEVLVDAHGDLLPMHEVFRMSMEDIKTNGWGQSVTAEGRAGKRNGDGPTFNLTYLDQANGTGVGFDDPNLGAARRATLEAAFAYYASLMEDYGSADIEIRESFSGNPVSNPFGYSAAYYFGSKGFNQPFTKAHITTGNDPYGPYPDGYMQFNFHPNLNYNYVVGANPASDQYDFYTIALHEILHILGFTSYSTATGESAASEGIYTSFDGFLAGHDKDALFEVTGSGPTTQVSLPEDGALTNNQVWFELYEGQYAPVFSPSSFSSSSLDHFDNSRSEHGQYLMHPSLTNGDAFKLLHEDEVRVLEQLGYTVNYSIATSIEEGFGQDAPVKVTSGLYPNPAFNSQPVKIDLAEVNANEVLVIVYDMMGRESYSKVILNRGAGPVTAIDPYNNLTPGMYIVVGSTNDELFNEKLVIR